VTEICVKSSAAHPKNLLQTRLSALLQHDKPGTGDPRKNGELGVAFNQSEQELIPEVVTPSELGKSPRLSLTLGWNELRQKIF
jgi:hypothetical protein